VLLYSGSGSSVNTVCSLRGATGALLPVATPIHTAFGKADQVLIGACDPQGFVASLNKVEPTSDAQDQRALEGSSPSGIQYETLPVAAAHLGIYLSDSRQPKTAAMPPKTPTAI
jgi:hypothetical protein